MKKIISVTMLIILFNGLIFAENNSYNEQIIYSDGDYTVSVITDAKEPRYLPFPNMGSRRWQNCTIKWWYNPAYQPFSTEEMLEAIKSAVNAWEKICGIKFIYMGITNQELKNKADDKLVIGWLPQNIFEERFGAYSGYARVWWGNLTYIYDAEISLNFEALKNDSIYNLQGIITHEFGHILGLTHSNIQESIMFANPYHTYEYQRTLRQDDINGAVFLYPYSSCGECLSGWSQYVSGAGSFQSTVNSSDCTFMNISLSDTTNETIGGTQKIIHQCNRYDCHF